MTRPDTYLRIDGLSVAADTLGLRLLSDVTLRLAAGGSLGLVGESGSGKSLTLHAIAGLLPPGLRYDGGSVHVDGRDVVRLPEHARNELRGRHVGFVFQDPARALDPLTTVGRQVAEGPRRHLGLRGSRAREHAVEWLGRVGLPEPRRAYEAYPHELSGGMRQRVMIACALACAPRLLLADEPTTALDVTIQAQILALLHRLRRDLGLALVFVSHDLAVVSQLCEQVGVLYAGQLVEHGPTRTVLTDPRHAYTQALLASMPERHAGRPGALPALAGAPPEPHAFAVGCRFQPRCPHAVAGCSELTHRLAPAGHEHVSACIHGGVGLPPYRPGD